MTFAFKQYTNKSKVVDLSVLYHRGEVDTPLRSGLLNKSFIQKGSI